MAKNKIQVRKNFLVYGCFLVLIVLIFVYINSLGRTPKNINSSPVPTPQSGNISNDPIYKEDIVNDGIYSNERYGFKFTYPKNSFKFQNDYLIGDDKSVVWSNIAIKNDRVDFSKPTFIFAVQSENSQFLEGAYQIFDTMNVGETKVLGFYNVTKLGGFTRNSTDVKTFYRGNIPGAEVDDEQSYIAAWKMNGKLLYLSLTTLEFKNLQPQREVFEQIVNSIEFIK